MKKYGRVNVVLSVDQQKVSVTTLENQGVKLLTQCQVFEYFEKLKNSFKRQQNRAASSIETAKTLPIDNLYIITSRQLIGHKYQPKKHDTPWGRDFAAMYGDVIFW